MMPLARTLVLSAACRWGDVVIQTAMTGVQETPGRLFYDFCLDEHVPCDHPLRGIDRHLDLANLRHPLKPVLQPEADPWSIPS